MVEKLRNLSLDILVALSLLTRIPLKLPEDGYQNSARAVWSYWIVGVIWGGTLSCIIIILLAGGIDLKIAVIFSIILGLFLTGVMHEDGLADSADGFWGGWSKERRLEIMKDSRIGAYGVAALVLCLLLRWQLLTETFVVQTNAVALIIACAALSRAIMPLLMAQLPHARDNGLSHSVGRPKITVAALGFALCACFVLALLGSAGLVLILIALLTCSLCGLLAWRKIGGQTGDVLGASAVVTELSLLSIATLL